MTRKAEVRSLFPLVTHQPRSVKEKLLDAFKAEGSGQNYSEHPFGGGSWELEVFTHAPRQAGNVVSDYPALIAKIDHLQSRLDKLCRESARRRIWRLGHLEGLVRQRALTPQVAKAAVALLVKLHELALKNGIECLPGPQVERDEEDLEISWFDQSAKRSVTVASTPSGITRLSVMSNDGYDEIEAPSDELLIEKMRWIVGA